MRIEHLIDGKAVPGKRYFETVNPATQEVLAEMVDGGEAEVHAGLAAANPAFAAWAGLPAPQRAPLVRRLGDLIAQNGSAQIDEGHAVYDARHSNLHPLFDTRA